MKKFPLTVLIFYLLIIQVIGRGSIAGKWKIKYGEHKNMTKLLLATNAAVHLPLEIYDIERNTNAEVSTNLIYFEIVIENTKIATVEKRLNLSEINGSSWQGVVTITGHSFGYTQLFATLHDPSTHRIERGEELLDVSVVRNERLDISILTYSAAAIIVLMFINLGTVLDLERIRSIFIKPVGPALGFCCRYLIMPALAIALGALIFRINKKLQWALLLTAIAPSGGIANICQVFLKGNINLSLATTTLNSILALGMLPLWVYLMGPILYRDTSADLPFVDLAIGCIGLIVALVIGVLLRIFIPNKRHLLFRLLKPVSVFLSLSLVAVTVGINAFAFKEITFMIFLASLMLPLCGYIIAFGLSKLLRRSVTDGMTIALETSVINMSLPIVLLERTVEQPMADMIIVVPILSALISLFLVVIFYVVRRIFGWNTKQDLDAFDEKTILVK